MTVPQSQNLEKKEIQHESSQAHIPAFWRLFTISTYVLMYVVYTEHGFTSPAVPTSA